MILVGKKLFQALLQIGGVTAEISPNILTIGTKNMYLDPFLEDMAIAGTTEDDARFIDELSELIPTTKRKTHA